MVKHITGPGTSKNDQVQVKTDPGATTDEIIDFIKPTIRQKSHVAIVHYGMNDLTKDTNTINRVRKVVEAVKKIDTKAKINLGFSGIIARGEITKEENIVSTNNRLETIVKEMSFFLDNSNIDASCLNKTNCTLIGKVHPTHQTILKTTYLTLN